MARRGSGFVTFGSMPTYSYKCNDCDHSFDALQSIKADPLSECPECSSSNVQRLIGAGSGIVFKGSGFYVTDYKNKDSSEAKKTTPKPASSDN